MKKSFALVCVIASLLTSCFSSETSEQTSTQTQPQTELPTQSSAVFRTFKNNGEYKSYLYIYLENGDILSISAGRESAYLFAEKGDTITYCGDTLLDIAFHK